MWEYNKHRQLEFEKKTNSIEKAAKTCEELVALIEQKIKSQCIELSKNGYPDIDELENCLVNKVDEIGEVYNSYFEKHQDLDYLNNWDEDKVLNIVNKFQKMPDLGALFIYNLCKEGEYRYKQKTPPGYKDDKKDGVSKYGDLIVWSETCCYAKRESKNIIFVTDDVKEDWWAKEDDGTIIFRKELIKEFFRKTRSGNTNSSKLVPLVGYDLYRAIAREYRIDTPDAISLILNYTDESFVEEVQSKVFDSIWMDIAYSGESYLNDTAHVGSEGIDEWELDSVEFESYERIEADSCIATYVFTYTICISGVSHDYWGRDEDTKEIITSPERRHECSGTVIVLVTRAIDTVINWNEDFDYQSAEIEEVTIVEDSYEDDDSDFMVRCSECGDEIGYEWEFYNRDYKGRPICDSCMTTNRNGFVCPKCGLKYPEEMRGGSGTFCINCENECD